MEEYDKQEFILHKLYNEEYPLYLEDIIDKKSKYTRHELYTIIKTIKQKGLITIDRHGKKMLLALTKKGKSYLKKIGGIYEKD